MPPPPASAAANALPDVLTPVLLRLEFPHGASVELDSRVSDVETVGGADIIVVARPDLSALADAGTYPREDEELTLAWALPACQMQVPVTAVAERRPYGPVWVLTALGAPRRVQRREFFRIPTTLPAMLAPVVEGEPPEEPDIPATIVELSEGGALICCETGIPEPGALVKLSFILQGKTITADAKVVRHDLPPKSPPRAALRFLDPSAHGDHIRRVAFAVQRSLARTRPD